ncbi:tetratricopeptide repeat protein [Patescibacteria group bacterium]
MKKIFYLILVLVAISSMSGWFIYKDLNRDDSSLEETISTPSTSTPEVGVNKEIPIPDLYKEIIFYSELSEGAKKQTILDIEYIRGQLKEDLDNYQNWLQLGLFFKLAEDYKSVQEAWEYASLIRPHGSVAFHNLGDLYHLYLPDYARSEINYRKAITNDPEMIMNYQKLHELYIYSYKEKESLADDILEEGLRNNPNNPLLQYILNEYNSSLKQ